MLILPLFVAIIALTDGQNIPQGCGPYTTRIIYTKYGVICGATQEEPDLSHLAISQDQVNRMLSDAVLVPLKMDKDSQEYYTTDREKPQQNDPNDVTPAESVQIDHYQMAPSEIVERNRTEERSAESLSNDDQLYLSRVIEAIKGSFDHHDSNHEHYPFHHPSHYDNSPFASQESPHFARLPLLSRLSHLSRVRMHHRRFRRNTPEDDNAQPETFKPPQIIYGFRPVYEPPPQQSSASTRYYRNPDWSANSRAPKYQPIFSASGNVVPEKPVEVVTGPPLPDDEVPEVPHGKRKLVLGTPSIIRVPKDSSSVLSAPLSYSIRVGSGSSKDTEEQSQPSVQYGLWSPFRTFNLHDSRGDFMTDDEFSHLTSSASVRDHRFNYRK